MSKIKIMTDTASDISIEQAEAAGIEMLSFVVSANGKSYREQRDLTKEEFYDLLANADELPTTSQITMFTFQELFQKYLEEGYTDLIYVSINAGGSATYQNACNAREALYEEIPNAKDTLKIHIIDSGNYTACYGYPVLKAAEMANNGESVEEILKFLEYWMAHVGVYFIPMTLKFVRKSGRLTAVSAFAGEVLGLRPIIRISHGKISTADKIRGDKNIVPRLTQKIMDTRLPDAPYIVIQGIKGEYANQVEKVLTEKLGYPPLDRVKIGAAVAVNAGYDLTAVAVLEKQ